MPQLKRPETKKAARWVAPYIPERVAEIRAQVAHCKTWPEARAELMEITGSHADNVTRMNRKHGFWRPSAEQLNQSVAKSAPSEYRDRGREFSDTAFDASTETSTSATIDEVVGLLKVNLDEWRPRGFSVTRKKSGFGWSARFERRPEKHNPRLIADLKADLQIARPKQQPIKYKTVESDRLLIVAPFDAHLGKLSWAEQDGQNYDLKIAKEVFMRAVYDLVAKAKQQGAITRILFPVGNDYMTCDTDTNLTTAGTLQSVDGRFPKIYREARRLLCDAIEYLKTIAPVDVVVIPGNHERNSMFHLGDALECWFHGDPNVTVDNRWVSRKYYTFGQTMFGLTHGDTIKQDKLPLGGAVEERERWGKAKRCVWLLGHFHHYQLNEYMGVQVWILPSLSGSDGYHQQNGYIGAARCAVAMLYSETDMIGMFQSTPEN